MSFFEQITDGLKLYEVLMLALGSLMFLVMLTLLIIFAAQRRSLKQLLYYFIIPVIMLGWSSLQKIKIDAKGIELDKTLAEYEKKSSEENKEKVEALIEDLKNRDVNDPAVVKKIARAEFMIGKPQESLKTIETLPDKEKKDSSVNNLKSSILISESLKNQLHIIQNTADSNQIRKLNEIQKEAINLEVKNVLLDSSIHAADMKITEFRRLNPKVDINKTSTHQPVPHN